MAAAKEGGAMALLRSFPQGRGDPTSVQDELSALTVLVAPRYTGAAVCLKPG
jgi:hypothetical protein